VQPFGGDDQQDNVIQGLDMGSGMGGVDISRAQDSQGKFLAVNGQIDLNSSGLDHKHQVLFMVRGKERGVGRIVSLGEFFVKGMIFRLCKFGQEIGERKRWSHCLIKSCTEDV
jgi:hypothetical protein